MGQLVFQATAGGQVALVGPNPSSSFALNVPAVNGNLVTTGDTGTVTNTMLANSSLTIGGTSISLGGSSSTIANDLSISGLTVGKGGGAVANNTAVGYQALYSNTIGTPNTAIGFQALNANTTGPENTALGYQAASANTTGGGNTYIGHQAGIANTTGGGNISLGRQSGSNITTGAFNVCLGYTSTVAAATDNYEIVICALGSVGKGSSTGFISPNGGGVYQGNNSTLWAITSDQRLKKNIVDNTVGLDAISKIQVRNFEYRTADEVTEVSPDQAIQKTGVQLGAIAQELAEVLPECVKQESTGIYTVNADPLIWYLVNAVKELKAEIDQLKGVK